MKIGAGTGKARDGTGSPPTGTWGGLLAGCGVMLVAGLLGAAVLAAFAFGWYRQTERRVGVVSEEAVRASLGELPWYPGAELDVEATRAVLLGGRLGERAMRMSDGALGDATAVLATRDSPEAVAAYYRRTHELGEWGTDRRRVEDERSPDGTQLRFENRENVLWVHTGVEADTGRTVIWLMRMRRPHPVADAE